VRSRLPIILVIAVAVGGGLAATPDPGPPVSLKEALRRTGAWVERFAAETLFIVGEERYVQEYRERGDPLHGVRRETRSEIVLVKTPDAEARAGYPWVQYRDVLEVDGKRLPDHEGRLERLFKEPSDASYTRAGTLIDESARFNVGPLTRTVNVPSFVLFFLYPSNQRRFHFDLRGDEVVDDTPALLVAYREVSHPTLIRSPERRQDRPVRGLIWLDPGSGRVLKTRLEAEAEQHWSIEVEVTYGRDAHLDAWVPLTMHELYKWGAEAAVECTARYSNFRRFETSARVTIPR
jgi:hypothetical protein